MGAYSNPIQCRGLFKPWESCRFLLEEMPASTAQEVFGSDVVLPKSFTSRKISVVKIRSI